MERRFTQYFLAVKLAFFITKYIESLLSVLSMVYVVDGFMVYGYDETASE